jgi:hypothetical protein
MRKSKKNAVTARHALTDEELEQLSPYDRIKLTEDETRRLFALNQVRKQKRQERVVRIRAEQALLLGELRSVGLHVESVSYVSRESPRDEEAVPVLLRHLLLPYSSATKESIAHVLATPVPAVRKAWPVLVNAYRNARTGMGIVAPGDTRECEYLEKDALAWVLAVTVTNKTLDELISLARDPRHGPSRVLLLAPLRRRRRKNPMIRQLLDELASDPDLCKEIASWRAA